MLRCGKGERTPNVKKNRKLKSPKYSSLYTQWEFGKTRHLPKMI